MQSEDRSAQVAEQTTTDTKPNGETVVTTKLLGKWTEHVVKRAASEAYSAAMHQVAEQDLERQTKEDIRANKRNLNRMLTLMFALFVGLVITYVLSNGGIPQIGFKLPSWALGLAPYSFVITVLLDSTLAAYSFIKKY